MDWIDYVIRDLCELPGRTSPEDDPEAIVATPSEIRAAIEANLPRGITELQRQAVVGLLNLASAAFNAADDSEEVEGDNGREHRICSSDFDALSDALDALDELPDDQPGYDMTGPARAKWALREVITPTKEL